MSVGFRSLRNWTSRQHWAGWVISGVGLALAGLSLWYLIVIQALHFGTVVDQGTFAILLKAIEIGLLASFSLVLVYGGYWLAASQFDKERAWWAGLWTMVGLTGITAIVALITAIRVQQGEPISKPSLIQEMLLAAGGGALAGLLIGISTVRETVESERARKQRNSLLFINELLRHNVLNGMNIVMGNMDLLEEHVDQEGEHYLETTTERAETIVDLIKNVRRLVESVSEENELQPVPLSPTLEREVEKAKETYSNADIELADSVDCRIRADNLLQAVFENLLTNAIEHNNGSQPSVDISVTTQSETVVVRISDDGPGVPDECKERYFDAGEQHEGSVGQGLGLYLVDTLVDRYGGDVWIEDNELGGADVVLEFVRVD